MNRRKFLQLTGASVAGLWLPRRLRAQEQPALRYWLGPYMWEIDEDTRERVSRVAPEVARPVVNLTAPAKLADRQENGIALFAAEDTTLRLGEDYTDLGSGADAPLSATARNTITSRLNLPQALVANTVAGMLWEVLTVQADPTGQDRPKPLVPKSRGRVWELICKGRPRERKRFDVNAPEAVTLRALLQADYRRIRTDSIEQRLPEEHYRKVLGAWVQKYQLDYRWFQPADVPDERPLEPTTTLSDDFSGGLGAWNLWDGTWTNPSNRIRGDDNLFFSASVFYDTALSSDDHYSQINFIDQESVFALMGPVTRQPGAAENTGYMAFSRDSSNLLRMRVRVEGIGSDIANDDGNGYGAPTLLKLVSDGSSHTLFQDSADVLSATDTELTGNLYAGLCGHNTDWSEGDNFLAEDLAAGGAVFPDVLGGGANDPLGGGPVPYK